MRINQAESDFIPAEVSSPSCLLCFPSGNRLGKSDKSLLRFRRASRLGIPACPLIHGSTTVLAQKQKRLPAAKQEAAGRLLFAAVNAARLAGVDAEEALTFASKRYCAELLAQKEQSGTQVE